MYVQTCQGSEHRSVIPHVLPQTWAQWSGPVVIENTNTIQKYEIQDTKCMYKLAKGANIGQSAHTSFHRRGHNGLGPLR